MHYAFLLVFLFLANVVFGQSDSLPTAKPDTGYFAATDGTRIYYEIRGTGRPVLLIHGFIVNGSTWKKTPLLHDLVSNGFQVITMDLRGNGKSGKPHTETSYANDAEATDLIGLVNSLHLASYDVIGYSRGSIIVARLLHRDKRVRKAVLGGMGTGFTDPQWPRRIMFYEAFSGKPSKETEGAVAAAKRQGLDTLVLAYLQKYQPSTSPAELAKVKQPVLVISGAEDSDNGSAAALAKMLPAAMVVSVPGDHNHAASTQEFADKVLAFLKGN